MIAVPYGATRRGRMPPSSPPGSSLVDTAAMTFEERVVAVIKGTARGEVMTYGEVAREAGYPGTARAVGNVLAKFDELPWWRVVLSTGRMAPGKEADQSRRLGVEGVVVKDGRIVGWGLR